MKYDIFLSHCKENKSSTAVPLYQALSALGFRVWFDRGEILTGDMIYESIETALYDSSMIVALVATEYLQRTWTQYELHLAIELEQDHAHRQGKRVFPIYQKLDHKDVELIFPQLKDRAFESLSTDYFDVSTKEGHSILDRIVLFYFIFLIALAAHPPKVGHGCFRIEITHIFLNYAYFYVTASILKKIYVLV